MGSLATPYSVICCMRPKEVLPKVGFFCFSCSDRYVAMASVDAFTVGNFLNSRIKFCVCTFYVIPLLWKVLYQAVSSFSLLCVRLGCFVLRMWTGFTKQQSFQVTQRWSDGLPGPPCSRTYRSCLHVYLKSHFGDDKKHSLKCTIFFCFKGRMEADGQGNEGLFMICPLRTWFSPLELRFLAFMTYSPIHKGTRSTC